MWFKFLLPLGPFFYLYAKTVSEKISWFLYFFISFYYIAYSNDVNMLAILISVILIYSAYDIGYIYNNAETIKYEKSPTLRFSEDDLVFYEEKKHIIYSFKIIVSLLSAYILNFLFNYNFYAWFSCIAFIVFVFYIYNSTRGVVNFYLQFLLSCSRYSIPLFILTEYNLFVLLTSLFIFPIPNFLERTQIKKHNLPFTISNTPLFRVVYFSIFTFFVFLLCYLMSDWNNIWLFFLSCYFFVYRTFFYLISKPKG